jgi:hypothetical protein
VHFGQDKNVESSDRLSFDVHEMQAKGVRVLTQGLPAFPAELTPSTTTPLAYWKTESFGFVMFLAGSPDVENDLQPTIWTGQYHLRNDEWIPSGPWVGGGEGTPGLPDEMEDKAIRFDGRITKGPDDEGPAGVPTKLHSSRLCKIRTASVFRSVILDHGSWESSAGTHGGLRPVTTQVTSWGS